MTAVTEHVLDTARQLGESSPHGRLCPPFLACLDELPSTAPIPTLATRMANERALGLSFILAAQTWRQLVVSYGEDQASTIYGLSNNLVVFGGGKDHRFYQQLSDLIGSTTTTETRVHSRSHGSGRGWFGDNWSKVREPSWEQRRVPILEPAELRRIPPRQALVLAESHDPIIATLHRCIEGVAGQDFWPHNNAPAPPATERGRDKNKRRDSREPQIAKEMRLRGRADAKRRIECRAEQGTTLQPSGPWSDDFRNQVFCCNTPWTSSRLLN